MHKTLDNIKKLKHLILIVAILIVASCSQPRKEFAIDSSESKAALKADLELTEADVTKEVHYWLEDDSSSVAYFKTDSSTINRVIERLSMEPDTVRKYVWIPENSPVWFSPSIEPTDTRNRTWIKESSERKVFLQINEQRNACYFANLKWK